MVRRCNFFFFYYLLVKRPGSGWGRGGDTGSVGLVETHVSFLCLSTPDLVYDAVVFFLLFHRFSVVVGCGIWLSYFMIITFYRHRCVFALTFQKYWANVHVTMKFHIQYN